jgi:C1A family cysteine protease
MKPKNIHEEMRKHNEKRQKGTVVPSCLGGGAQKRSAIVAADEAKIVGALPTSFDWRQHKPTVVSPVKNQGESQFSIPTSSYLINLVSKK